MNNAAARRLESQEPESRIVRQLKPLVAAFAVQAFTAITVSTISCARDLPVFDVDGMVFGQRFTAKSGGCARIRGGAGSHFARRAIAISYIDPA